MWEKLGVIQRVKLTPEMGGGSGCLGWGGGLVPRMDGRPELEMGDGQGVGVST